MIAAANAEKAALAALGEGESASPGSESMQVVDAGSAGDAGGTGGEDPVRSQRIASRADRLANSPVTIIILPLSYH